MQPVEKHETALDEKHGRGGAGEMEALRMLDLFASVGVTSFDITHTNIEGEKRGFRVQGLEDAKKSMPFLVRSALTRQNNVIVRPHQPPAVFLVQLDDLDGNCLGRISEFAFLTLETSSGNFQAWVAVQSSADADFARRLRKGAGADASASGATRVAGTLNYKRKYEPDFPAVRIDGARLGLMVTQEALKAAGLVAEPETSREARPVHVTRRSRGRWPSYQMCVDRAPLAHNSDRADISRADFTWCMTAIDWGWSVADVAARLMEESEKAQENGYDYAITTARNAAAAVERRHGRDLDA